MAVVMQRSCSRTWLTCSQDDVIATTESELAVSSGEAETSWTRASGMTSTAATAVVGDVRPLGVASTVPRRQPNTQSFVLQEQDRSVFKRNELSLLIELPHVVVEHVVPVSGMSGFVPLFRSCGLFVHCCSIFTCAPIPEVLCNSTKRNAMGEQQWEACVKNSLEVGKEELKCCFGRFAPFLSE